MYYVYFLKSLHNGDIYIGSCEDVAARLARHNAGRVKSTKGYCPWVLLGSEAFETRAKAVQMEKFYKSGQQRELLKRKYTS